MPKRSSEHLAARREHIATAAEEVLVDNGVAGFSTTAVCRRAGVSMGNLYAYFPSKEDLLDALVTRAFQARQQWLDADSLPELRARLRDLIAFLQTPDGYRSSRLDVELGLVAHAHRRPADALASSTLHDAVKATLARLAGPHTDPDNTDIATDALTALVAGWSYLVSLGQGVPDHAIESVDQFLALLEAPDPSKD